MTKPVYAFIDSQNLNLGVQSQGWKLDWRKFRHLNTKLIIKGNVDAELVLHTMIQYKNFYLESKNKLLKIIIPNKHSESSLLKKFQKYKLFIYREKEKLEFKPKKIGRRST